MTRQVAIVQRRLIVRILIILLLPANTAAIGLSTSAYRSRYPQQRRIRIALGKLLNQTLRLEEVGPVPRSSAISYRVRVQLLRPCQLAVPANDPTIFGLKTNVCHASLVGEWRPRNTTGSQFPPDILSPSTISGVPTVAVPHKFLDPSAVPFGPYSPCEVPEAAVDLARTICVTSRIMVDRAHTKLHR